MTNITGWIVAGLFVNLVVGCSAPNVESVQAKVAENFFIDPENVEFSEVHSGGGYVCGLAAGRTRTDQFAGSRPFWADADGGSFEIMSANVPEGFLINAARNCPSAFVNELHAFTGSNLSEFVQQVSRTEHD